MGKSKVADKYPACLACGTPKHVPRSKGEIRITRGIYIIMVRHHCAGCGTKSVLHRRLDDDTWHYDRKVAISRRPR